MKNKIKSKFRVRLFLATIIRKLRVMYYKANGYDITYTTIIEGTVNLDKLNPSGIHIGENTLVAGNSTILSHDHCKRVNDNQPYLMDTYIGRNCFIAVNAIILPGIKIGDEVIVGAGSVVTKNIPSNCIVAGNPAKTIRENIKMNNFAALANWKPNK